MTRGSRGCSRGRARCRRRGRLRVCGRRRGLAARPKLGFVVRSNHVGNVSRRRVAVGVVHKVNRKARDGADSRGSGGRSGPSKDGERLVQLGCKHGTFIGCFRSQHRHRAPIIHGDVEALCFNNRACKRIGARAEHPVDPPGIREASVLSTAAAAAAAAAVVAANKSDTVRLLATDAGRVRRGGWCCGCSGGGSGGRSRGRRGDLAAEEPTGHHSVMQCIQPLGRVHASL